MSQLNIAGCIACDLAANARLFMRRRMKAIPSVVVVTHAREDANRGKCAGNGSLPRAYGTVGAQGGASTAPLANVCGDASAPL